MDGNRFHGRPIYVRHAPDPYANIYGTVRMNPMGKLRPALDLEPLQNGKSSSGKKPFNFLPWKKNKSKTDEYLQPHPQPLGKHNKHKFGSLSALPSTNLYRDWDSSSQYASSSASDLRHASIRSGGFKPWGSSTVASPWETYHNNINSSSEALNRARDFGPPSIRSASPGAISENNNVTTLSDSYVKFKPCMCEKKKSGPFGTLNFKSLRSTKCHCGFSSVRSSGGFAPPPPPRRKSILPEKVDLYSVHEDQAFSVPRPVSRSSDVIGSGRPTLYDTLNLRDGRRRPQTTPVNAASSSAQAKFLRSLENSASNKEKFNSVSSRKSILECDVTAYDLVKSYLKSTEDVDSDLDDDLSDNVIESNSISDDYSTLKSNTDSSPDLGAPSNKSKARKTTASGNSPSPVSSESESGIYSQPPSIRIGGHGMKVFQSVGSENNGSSQSSSLYSEGSKTNSVDSRTSSWSNGSISDDGIYSLPEPDYDSARDEYGALQERVAEQPYASSRLIGITKYDSGDVTNSTSIGNYKQYPPPNPPSQNDHYDSPIFSTVRRASSMVTLASRVSNSDTLGRRQRDEYKIPTIPEPPQIAARNIPPPPPPPPPPNFTVSENSNSSWGSSNTLKSQVSSTETENERSAPSSTPSRIQPSNRVGSSIAEELKEKLKNNQPILKKKPMEVKPPIKVNSTNPYAEVKSILKKTSAEVKRNEGDSANNSDVQQLQMLDEMQDMKKKKRVQFKSLSNESLVVEQMRRQSPSSSEEEWEEINRVSADQSPVESNQDPQNDNQHKIDNTGVENKSKASGSEEGFQTVEEFLKDSRHPNAVSQVPRLATKNAVASQNKTNKTEIGVKKIDHKIPISRPSQPPPPPPTNAKRAVASLGCPPPRPLNSAPKSYSHCDLRVVSSKPGDKFRMTPGLAKTSIPVSSSRYQQPVPGGGVFHSKGRPRQIGQAKTTGQDDKSEITAPSTYQKNGFPSPAVSQEATISSRGKSTTNHYGEQKHDEDENNLITEIQRPSSDEYFRVTSENDVQDSTEENQTRDSLIPDGPGHERSDDGHDVIGENSVCDASREKQFYCLRDSDECGGTSFGSTMEFGGIESTAAATVSEDDAVTCSIVCAESSKISVSPNHGHGNFVEAGIYNTPSGEETVFSNLLFVSCDSPPPPPLPSSPPPSKTLPPPPPARNSTTVLTTSSNECYATPVVNGVTLETRCDSSTARSQSLESDRGDGDYGIYESRRCLSTGATIVTISTGSDVPDQVSYSSPTEAIYEELPTTRKSLVFKTTPRGTTPFGRHRRSFFEGASKAEILKYLEGAKDRVVHQIAEEECGDSNNNMMLIDEEEYELPQRKIRTIDNFRNNPIRISNISSSSESSTISGSSCDSSNSDDAPSQKACRPNGPVEVERADSGVGIETSRPHRHQRKMGHHPQTEDELLCADCDQQMEPPAEKSDFVPLVCAKCDKKKSERKEIVTEIVETEFKYGKDLMIIKEEFFTPMEVAALLTKEQLNGIFLNLNELILVNRQFSEKLKDALDIAVEQGDEDLTTVNIGKLFLGTSSMLQAFEVYCIKQSSASLLLSNLEKDKELLRIFLRVSQMENSLLRRMNLSAFLMVPVQRVTKYPLLLNRLYKVTPYHHQDREALREAQLKIELHLDHINQQTKGVTGTKIWRRLSNISAPHRRIAYSVSDIGSIQFRKMAMEILQWSKEEIRFVMAGKLAFSAAADFTKSRRGKPFKFTSSHALLATLGKPNSNYRPDLVHDNSILFPRDTGIRDATLLLMKEKYGKYSLAREPLHLGSCVVSSELEEDDIIEIQEYTTKDSVYLKAECRSDAIDWLKQLRYHAKDLGTWRRRRNALANIMINGMVRQ